MSKNWNKVYRADWQKQEGYVSWHCTISSKKNCIQMLGGEGRTKPSIETKELHCEKSFFFRKSWTESSFLSWLERHSAAWARIIPGLIIFIASCPPHSFATTANKFSQPDKFSVEKTSSCQGLNTIAVKLKKATFYISRKDKFVF